MAEVGGDRLSALGKRFDLTIEDSPSLRRHLDYTLQKLYRLAVKDALNETELASAKQLDIPEICPWTLSALLDGDLDSL